MNIYNYLCYIFPFDNKLSVIKSHESNVFDKIDLILEGNHYISSSRFYPDEDWSI